MLRQTSTAFVRVGYWLTIVSLLLWLILKAWDFLPSWAHEHAPWLITLVILVLALWAITPVLEREWGKLIGVGLAGLAFALVREHRLVAAAPSGCGRGGPVHFRDRLGAVPRLVLAGPRRTKAQ